MTDGFGSAMQLTRFSDYGLRLMMMAAANGERRITIEETARTFDISRAHLMKVAQLLVREGFLKAARGRGGGLTLARPAESITIGAVVRATESDFAIVECMGSGNQCRITPACRLRACWARRSAPSFRFSIAIRLPNWSSGRRISASPGRHKIFNLPALPLPGPVGVADGRRPSR